MLNVCIRQLGMEYIVANGTHPGDWPNVLALQRQYPDSVVPQLGLHPWWVGKDPSDDDWFVELKRLLIENPHAGLGECGLDKSGSRKHTFQEQCVVFQRQICLALELNRPLSIHCVRAYGTMYDHVKDRIGGKIPVMLHAWAGSPEMTQMFAQLDNVFFSLNLTILRMNPDSCIRMVCSIPSHACLLESDGPDGRLDDIPEAALETWYDIFPSFKEDVRRYRQSIGMKNVNTPACTSLVGRLLALITGTPYESIHARATGLVKQLFAHYLQ